VARIVIVRYNERSKGILLVGCLLIALVGAWSRSYPIVAVGLLCGVAACGGENWIAIDAQTGSYQRYALVKPFGMPVSCPIQDIRCIYLEEAKGWRARRFSASLVIQPPSRLRPILFPVCAGPLEAVLEEVARVAEATQIPVIESSAVMAAHAAFQSVGALVEKGDRGSQTPPEGSRIL